MLLSVDISDFIVDVLNSVTGLLLRLVNLLDDIVIFNASDFGLGDFTVSLLDFNIGLLVTSIVVGAFVHVNKADNFYSNRKD